MEENLSRASLEVTTSSFSHRKLLSLKNLHTSFPYFLLFPRIKILFSYLLRFIHRRWLRVARVEDRFASVIESVERLNVRPSF
jgi:hypothetical protein